MVSFYVEGSVVYSYISPDVPEWYGKIFSGIVGSLYVEQESLHTDWELELQLYDQDKDEGDQDDITNNCRGKEARLQHMVRGGTTWVPIKTFQERVLTFFVTSFFFKAKKKAKMS